MARIRRETEVDRTEAALARHAAALPLARRAVEIAVAAGTAATPVGQRLLVVLVNELARMKGVVSTISVTGITGDRVLPGVPVEGADLEAGLAALVAGLNSPRSRYRAEIAVGPSKAATVRVAIGASGAEADIVVAADAWRALLGRYAQQADWNVRAPYGAALAAALTAAEVFKHLLAKNGLADPQRRSASDIAVSAFNFGSGDDAAVGPDVYELALRDIAVVGCGAGGSAALYVLTMQPGLSGEVGPVEPGRHKLPNLNRYLMTTASDVHEKRHKLGSAANHLARFAPGLKPTLYPVTWETLDVRPWPFLLSTVDTVPARGLRPEAAGGPVGRRGRDGARLDGGEPAGDSSDDRAPGRDAEPQGGRVRGARGHAVPRCPCIDRVRTDKPAHRRAQPGAGTSSDDDVGRRDSRGRDREALRRARRGPRELARPRPRPTPRAASRGVAAGVTQLPAPLLTLRRKLRRHTRTRPTPQYAARRHCGGQLLVN